MFYFDPRVIWGGFRHPTSIFRYLNIEILWKKDFFFDPQNQFFDWKIDFWVLKNKEKPGGANLPRNPRIYVEGHTA